jgi:hypothetical protein
MKNFGPEFFLDEANRDFTQKFIEDALPYTERHAARIDKMCQNVMFLDFAWQNIKLNAKDENGADIEDDEEDEAYELSEFEKMLELMKIESARQKANNVTFD